MDTEGYLRDKKLEEGSYLHCYAITVPRFRKLLGNELWHISRIAVAYQPQDFDKWATSWIPNWDMYNSKLGNKTLKLALNLFRKSPLALQCCTSMGPAVFRNQLSTESDEEQPWNKRPNWAFLFQPLAFLKAISFVNPQGCT